LYVTPCSLAEGGLATRNDVHAAAFLATPHIGRKPTHTNTQTARSKWCDGRPAEPEPSTSASRSEPSHHLTTERLPLPNTGTMSDTATPVRSKEEDPSAASPKIEPKEPKTETKDKPEPKEKEPSAAPAKAEKAEPKEKDPPAKNGPKGKAATTGLESDSSSDSDSEDDEKDPEKKKEKRKQRRPHALLPKLQASQIVMLVSSLASNPV
jgi:hypothetical protein